MADMVSVRSEGDLGPVITGLSSVEHLYSLQYQDGDLSSQSARHRKEEEEEEEKALLSFPLSNCKDSIANHCNHCKHYD